MTRHPFTSAFTRQGRRAWLLWLALLWPLASTAALLHSYGHGHAALLGGVQQVSTKVNGDDLAVHAAQGCDLCLAAAASLVGAATRPVHAAPVRAAAQAGQTAPATPRLIRLDGPHFAARAPPLA